MKVKTSVTLSPDVLEAIDRRCPEGRSRSEFLEQAAWDVIRRADRVESDAREIEILNAIADGKFGEPPDSYLYGVPPESLGSDFFDEDFAVATR